ncbi:hypothetical protein BU16DRAFT_559353 [Lophium mytilinum]|uniref:Uncharacterized protein n=1 Tax=Lophium mytilinum TaxID=390894 RepID=A0A6A6QYT2_9PEZI|nr:hypothetical protein BU16DRAFT_559353 [Lophium mytilinum]
MTGGVRYRFNDRDRVVSEKDPRLVRAHIDTEADAYTYDLSVVITLEAWTIWIECAFPRYGDEQGPYCDADTSVYFEGMVGNRLGIGYFDDMISLEGLPCRCKAVRIAQRCYLGRTGERNIVYSLLLQPDSKVDSHWRRIGIAIFDEVVEAGAEVTEVYDWGCREELELR